MMCRRMGGGRSAKNCWGESSDLASRAAGSIVPTGTALPQPRHLNPPTPSPAEPARNKPRGKLFRYILVGLLLLIGVTIFIPVYGRPCPKAQRTKFLSQVKGVFPALKMYAGDHEGKFPSQLSDLEPDYIQPPFFSRLFYVEEKSGIRVEPIYFSGYTDAVPPATILIGSTLSGGKYRIAVCADGSAQVFLEAKYQELLKRQPQREW